jgi:hypothetical protein
MMKQLLTLAFSSLLFSPVSGACPNLSGSYLCKQNTYRKDTIYSFTQSQNASGAWFFTMAANPPEQPVVSYFRFWADGVERDVVDTITGQELRLAAFCTAEKLAVSGTTKTDQAQLIRFSEELSLTAEGHLSNVSLDINGNWISEVCLRHLDQGL